MQESSEERGRGLCLSNVLFVRMTILIVGDEVDRERAMTLVGRPVRDLRQSAHAYAGASSLEKVMLVVRALEVGSQEEGVPTLDCAEVHAGRPVRKRSHSDRAESVIQNGIRGAELSGKQSEAQARGGEESVRYHDIPHGRSITERTDRSGCDERLRVEVGKALDHDPPHEARARRGSLFVEVDATA